MESIGGFKLTNEGAIVGAASWVEYIDGDGETKLSERWYWNGGEPLVMTNLGSKGVPAGARIQVCIEIQAGDDLAAGHYFQWDSSSPACAEYTITGTTLNAALHFDGIKVEV
jgi:hypothetical protein